MSPVGWISRAAALEIDLAFAGQVTSVQTNTPGIPFGPVGSLVSGTISLPLDYGPSNEGGGLYEWLNIPASIQAPGAGGQIFSAALYTIDIVDGPTDSFQMAGAPFDPYSSISYDYAAVSLTDTSGTALSSTDLVVPTSLAPWTSGEVTMFSWDPQSKSYNWTTTLSVSSLSVVGAPEPSSWVLVALGMCCLVARGSLPRIRRPLTHVRHAHQLHPRNAA
jgi:hypothetical protein